MYVDDFEPLIIFKFDFTILKVRGYFRLFFLSFEGVEGPPGILLKVQRASE